jgi:hypothetical protein
MDNSSNNTQECTELKNIKYKSLGINCNNHWNESKSYINLQNLDTFLENEKNNNINEPWSKLDKTVKTKKLLIFAESYKKEKNIDDVEFNGLINFFKDCLDHKKLQRVKDVIYDKETGIVKDIPGLFHNKVKNHFTIKNIDKRVSTIKSLAPKKIKGTIKNSVNRTESDNEHDNSE